MKTHISFRSFAVVLALWGALCGGTSAQNNPMTPAQAGQAQVWIGGSRAWPDFIAPSAAPQWKFLAANVDGFYINNFAMRLTDKSLNLDPDAQKRFEALQQMNRLLKSDKLFYETDQKHSTDAFDTDALKSFQKAGFDVVAVTINYGTNPTRTAILTDNGKRLLYYMFGPWHGGGDIKNAENKELRANILAHSGGSVDGPVTMWRKNAGKMKPMVYSAIQWCHAHGKKFLYLLAPNESGSDFLMETQKLAHDMEDNDANPDIWAVSFYGPKVFRDKLETLPESLPNGTPAKTFSGAAYWLIHHLRDPDGALRLTRDSNGPRQFNFTLKNQSNWLDLTPVVRARFDGQPPAGLRLKWTIGDRDVTAQINGEGLVFNRELRLNPAEKRALKLQISGETKGVKVPVRLEMMPHPSTPQVKQSVNFSIESAR